MANTNNNRTDSEEQPSLRLKSWELLYSVMMVSKTVDTAMAELEGKSTTEQQRSHTPTTHDTSYIKSIVRSFLPSIPSEVRLSGLDDVHMARTTWKEEIPQPDETRHVCLRFPYRGKKGDTIWVAGNLYKDDNHFNSLIAESSSSGDEDLEVDLSKILVVQCTHLEDARPMDQTGDKHFPYLVKIQQVITLLDFFKYFDSTSYYVKPTTADGTLPFRWIAPSVSSGRANNIQSRTAMRRGGQQWEDHLFVKSPKEEGWYSFLTHRWSLDDDWLLQEDAVALHLQRMSREDANLFNLS